MTNILVYAEHKSGKFRKASFEAISAANKIAKTISADVIAVAVGSGFADADAQALGKYGAKSVTVLDDAAVSKYSADGYAKALAKVAKDKNAVAFFLSSTSQGKDLAPRIAAHLQVGLASDCTELLVADGKIRGRRPVYAGKSYVTLQTTASPFMATLRPNVFAVESTGSNATVEKTGSGIGAEDCKGLVKEFIAASGGKLDVGEASVVVSGGRGMKGPEHWKMIEDLATAFGGATGASRAVVDAGWRGHDEQVGQTGKTVAPVLYIAVGISGAIQHLAGMRTSKTIVAINKDPEAPIFKIADYGIVGDAFEIIPPLTKAVQDIKAKEH